MVEIDLSLPGAVASEGEIHFDPSIGELPPRRSGMVIEPFGAWDYAFDVRCGIGYLGEINGIHWVSDRTELPAAWQDSVDTNGELLVSITIETGTDAHIEASLNDERVRYDAVREPPPVCEG